MKKFLSIIIVSLLLISMAGCGTAAPPEPAEMPSGESTGIKDGTYTVVSKGMADGLKLEVAFAAGKISSVTVLESNETAGISDPAIERIPARIVENNSVNVDVVSGATMTSNGIIEGVKQAILDAGGKVEDF